MSCDKADGNCGKAQNKVKKRHGDYPKGKDLAVSKNSSKSPVSGSDSLTIATKSVYSNG